MFWPVHEDIHCTRQPGSPITISCASTGHYFMLPMLALPQIVGPCTHNTSAVAGKDQVGFRDVLASVHDMNTWNRIYDTYMFTTVGAINMRLVFCFSNLPAQNVTLLITSTVRPADRCQHITHARLVCPCVGLGYATKLLIVHPALLRHWLKCFRAKQIRIIMLDSIFNNSYCKL